jgi:hypothetical protein
MTKRDKIVTKISAFLMLSKAELDGYSFRLRQLWNDKYNAYSNAEKFINKIVILCVRNSE